MNRGHACWSTRLHALFREPLGPHQPHLMSSAPFTQFPAPLKSFKPHSLDFKSSISYPVTYTKPMVHASSFPSSHP